MTTGIGDLVAHLVTDTSQWSTGLNKAQSQMSSFASSITKQMAGMFAGFATADFAIGFGKQALAAAEEDIQATKKFQAVLDATGGSAGVTADEIGKLAEQLQRTTKFSDDATVGAAALLAKFTNIKGDNFKEVLKLAQDLSALKGTGLDESVELFGKALDSPIEGIARLRKAGVNLTAEQQEQIKSFMAVGDAASAQGVMLAALEGRIGGVAEATLTSTERMTNAWGVMIEAIGKSEAIPAANVFTKIILPQLELLGDGFQKSAAEADTFLERNKIVALKLAETWAGAFIPLVQIRNRIQDLNKLLEEQPKPALPEQLDEDAPGDWQGPLLPSGIDLDEPFKNKLKDLADELAILRDEATRTGIEIQDMFNAGKLTEGEANKLLDLQEEIEIQKEIQKMAKEAADEEEALQNKMMHGARKISDSAKPDDKLKPEDMKVGAFQKGSSEAVSAVHTAMRGNDTIQQKQLTTLEEIKAAAEGTQIAIEGMAGGAMGLVAGSLSA